MPKKKQPDALAGNKVLVENNLKRILKAEFKNGVCTLDTGSGEISYNNGKDGEDKSFSLPTFDLVGMPVSLHCSDEKTIVVFSYSIVVANRGLDGLEKSQHAEIFGDDSFDFRTFFTPLNSENKPYAENISSVVSNKTLFVLAKDSSAGTYDIIVIDLQEREDRIFEIGKSFSGTVMKFYKDILFVAGNAQKGKPYLVVARMSSDGLEGEVFTAKTDMEGEVSFKENGNDLILNIGKRKTKIEVKNLQKEMDDKKTTCFSTPEKDSFDCITIQE